MTERGERYLDVHQVADKVGLSAKTVRRKAREGDFPLPFHWAGAVRWLESEVDRWMVQNAAVNRMRPEELAADEKSGGTQRDREGQAGTSLPGGPEATGEAKKRR